MLEACLEEGQYFKQIINAAMGLKEDATLDYSKDGVAFQFMGTMSNFRGVALQIRSNITT